MSKKIVVTIMLLIMLTPVLFSKKDRKKIVVTKEMLEDFVTISNDTDVFEETDLMKLYDPDEELLAYYGQFKHQNLELYNRKVFDLEKELLLTLIYGANDSMGMEYSIKFKDKDDNVGKVVVKKKAGFAGLVWKFDIDYYEDGYDMKFFVTSNGFGGIQYQTILYKGNDIIMYWKRKGNVISGKSKNNLFVQKDYMKNNRMDVAYWTMIFFMIY